MNINIRDMSKETLNKLNGLRKKYKVHQVVLVSAMIELISQPSIEAKLPGVIYEFIKDNIEKNIVNTL